jgi:hypothetical protein
MLLLLIGCNVTRGGDRGLTGKSFPAPPYNIYICNLNNKTTNILALLNIIF